MTTEKLCPVGILINVSGRGTNHPTFPFFDLFPVTLKVVADTFLECWFKALFLHVLLFAIGWLDYENMNINVILVERGIN